MTLSGREVEREGEEGGKEGEGESVCSKDLPSLGVDPPTFRGGCPHSGRSFLML